MSSLPPPSGITKRQVILRYGFNAKTLDGLIAARILKIAHVKPGKRSTTYLDTKSVAALEPGQHYVVCAECGAFQNQMTTKHLRACSGMVLNKYRERHPKAMLVSGYSAKNKQKTETQKRAQSEKLKARFQTPEGEVTRKQISLAAKRKMDSGYREQAAAHLRALNTPEARQTNSRRMKILWAQEGHRKKLAKWRAENRDKVLETVAHARSFITRTFTAPHRRVKLALTEAGLDGFVTELRVGFYHIDEAHPELKLAVEIDGCYWHGCTVCGFEPLSGMRARDRSKDSFLRNRGWQVVRLAEHAIRADLDECVGRVKKAVEGRRC